MNDATATPSVLTTKIKSTAQLLLCKGCCCGKTERGLPDVPVDRIKAAWKADKLNRVVQLTVSGCLGPCDVPNVALVLTPEGSEWLGLLDGDPDYDALIAWARDCQAAAAILPLPAALDARRLRRFTPEGERQEATA